MRPNQAASRWFITFRPNLQASLRLFCFPYAGGGANLFRRWPEQLSPFIEVSAAQLPGRGTRIAEKSFTSMLALVESVAAGMRPLLDKPFAFFGHSMGALIAFELARHLRREGGPNPLQLFASGHAAPQLPRPYEPTYNLPDPEMIAELRSLNGTPPDVLEQPEMMQLMLPLLRADFELCQTYLCATEPPLNCPITVFGGSEDRETGPEKLEAWIEQTTAPFSTLMFPGDHFFLHSAEPRMLRIIEQQSHNSMLRRS